MKYITLFECEDTIGMALTKLEKQVDEHIKEGFKPLGGVSICATFRNLEYAAQAMIKGGGEEC